VIELTPEQHEARIDSAERHMLEANNRPDRIMFCHAFLEAIVQRNQARTAKEMELIEQARGLRE
jgi:hypothetical protein